MKITVTQDDIDNGLPRQPCHCPIARAAKRAGVLGTVVVSLGYIYDGPGNEALLPEAALEFNRRLDQGLSVQPFEFEVEL